MTNSASYAYTLGASGNRLSVSELGGRHVAYNYDDLYRLTSETISGDASQNGTISYQYDSVGNRLQLTSTVSAIPAGTLFYDANDRLSTDTYDGSGNTVSSGGIGDVYDFENHLVQHGLISIVYDGDGNRVSKTAGGVTTQYLVDTHSVTGYAQVLQETIGTSISRKYTYGLSLISENQLIGSTQTVSFYGVDGHGSVRQLTDRNGSVTDTYVYDAFGNLLSSTGTTPNLYRYSGEQFDSDLGLYYNRARYLDVRNGRFWGMDEVEGSDHDPLSLHKYVYTNANPVNVTDPSGHEGLASINIGLAVFAAIVAIGTVGLIAEHYLHRPDFGLYFSNDFFWKDVGDRHMTEFLSAAEISTVKQNALQALRAAFPYPRVKIHEGRGSDNTVEVATYEPKQSCGGTKASPSQYSFVNYACVLSRAKSNNSNSSRDDILAALGWGIGNVAAHEIGHQLALTVVNGDPTIPGTYDSHDQDDPAQYIFGSRLHWTDKSLQELDEKFK